MHCTCTASYVGMGCRAVLPEGALSGFFCLRSGRGLVKEAPVFYNGKMAFLKEDGVEHGCTCTEAGILLDIFTPMREDFV